MSGELVPENQVQKSANQRAYQQKLDIILTRDYLTQEIGYQFISTGEKARELIFEQEFWGEPYM